MRRWIGLAAAGALLICAPLVLRNRIHADDLDDALAKHKGERGFSKAVTPPPLTGVDVVHMHEDKGEYTAPAHGGRTAHLTINPTLQKLAHQIMRHNQIPEAAVVMTETATGKVLVYASHVEKGAARDLCAEAKAPAASIFKIITGSSLVEEAGLTAETKQCYWGGHHRLQMENLLDDPRKDKDCATLTDAMGRSLNTVIARLASKHLDAKKLLTTAKGFGFNEGIPFDVPVQPHTIKLPDDTLGFARTSAGFWNTTLSPIAGATVAMTVANRGVMIRPYLVETVTDKEGSTLFKATSRQVVRRAIKPETADQVTKMMEATVRDGTSYKAFHDKSGASFLPDISVASKTGTLTGGPEAFYTWFVGFAPSRAPEVTISVLVVNGPMWRVKANLVGREMLRAYFGAKNAPGVTVPKAVAAANVDKSDGDFD
jgi:penicillin-binding protein A